MGETEGAGVAHVVNARDDVSVLAVQMAVVLTDSVHDGMTYRIPNTNPAIVDQRQATHNVKHILAAMHAATQVKM